MTQKSTRRSFVKVLAAGVAAPLIVPALGNRGYASNEKVRHFAFGCQGMGGHDLGQLASSPHLEVVGLCDIDDRHLADAKKKYPGAKTYNDFREVFDREHKSFDSCHVTVPDHMHAPIAMTAVKHGKHTYCQKPLTHEILEARMLREAAKEAGVTTQMGTQIHSHTAYRTGVALIQEGAIGRVKEVHTWADRSWSNNGRPEPKTPPPHIHWDLWLGVAPERPWGPGAYHPKQWWSWIDFGTGNLGDMGCHLFDPVVSALALGAPTRVQADCDPPKNETWPNSGRVMYDFPGTVYTAGPIRMTWYDGGFRAGHHPPATLLGLENDAKLPSQGSIFVGEKGAMLLPHWSRPTLYPQKDFAGYEYPERKSLNHWHTFVDACRGVGRTTAHFDYAGPMTETVLLGNLARRFPGQPLDWDVVNLKVTNYDEANNFIMRDYRKGWNIPGINA